MDADPRDHRLRELGAQVARLHAENEQLRQLVKQLQERVEFLRIRQHFAQHADDLILPPRADSEEEWVANRLRKRRQGLFSFLDQPGVEATYPPQADAKRALRPAVMARKLSCGNKTERGKRTWEILASLAATCHPRGQNVVELLRPNLLLPHPFPAGYARILPTTV